MPFYNYYCEKCEEVFEIRASFEEKDAGLEPECPKCQSKNTRQVITAGLLIHGNGGTSLPLSSCDPNAGPGCC
ncbi:MAG: zinc ribbon domain-containing protein [Anaerolineales bacterium]|nr:zinc ribbon domain-containing protein [Anaerolineales bacterium]